MPVYSRVRQAEGCEGLLVLRDSATGGAFTIVLWRDQTAMDSGIKVFSEDPVQAETFQRALEAVGIEVVGEPRRMNSNFVKGYEALPVRIPA